MNNPFKTAVSPDAAAYEACIMRKGTPKRPHLVEFFLDNEIQQEIITRFDISAGIPASDPHHYEKTEIALQRFLGYDFAHSDVKGQGFEAKWANAADTAGLSRSAGRNFVDETRGPVATREEFDKYRWPSTTDFDTRSLEWLDKNLPDDMCITCGNSGHILEDVTFLMGYETLCEALYEDLELVKDITKKVSDYYIAIARVAVQFKRVRIVFSSDDMGFRTGPLVGPDTLRDLFLPAHKKIAEIVHSAGKIYFLHSCGKLDTIMENLVSDVRIDAKHSFEDNIEDICDAKKKYGSRIALLGGVDVDLLCRAPEPVIRERVRTILKGCLPGGGFALGTGNTVANYIPVDNYLAMVDEARNYTG
jgi:uroporphyrinogen decarboxylase